MLDKESDNYYRLITLVVKTGTRTIREVFKKHTAYDIASVLKKHRKEIDQLKSKRVLTDPQYQLLNADTPILEKFDISLLFILIQNICTSVETPPGIGWKTAIVPSSDKTIGGYIIGIRNVRNEVVAHSSDTRVSNDLFRKNWAMAEKCLKELAAHVDMLDDIAEEIKNTESKPLTADSNINLEATLKKWRKEDNTERVHLNEKIDEQVTNLKTVMNDFSVIRKQIEDGQHTGNNGSANQQTSKGRIADQDRKTVYVKIMKKSKKLQEYKKNGGQETMQYFNAIGLTGSTICRFKIYQVHRFANVRSGKSYKFANCVVKSDALWVVSGSRIGYIKSVEVDSDVDIPALPEEEPSTGTKRTLAQALQSPVRSIVQARIVKVNAPNVNEGHCFVRCKAIPSMPSTNKKKCPDYSVWAMLSKMTGCINSADCSCTAGEGEGCKHIAALLYVISDITEKKQDGKLTPTSMKCKWNNPRKRKLTPKESQDLTFQRVIHGRQSVKINILVPVYNIKNSDDVDKFQNKRLGIGSNAGWLKSFSEKTDAILIPNLHVINLSTTKPDSILKDLFGFFD